MKKQTRTTVTSARRGVKDPASATTAGKGKTTNSSGAVRSAKANERAAIIWQGFGHEWSVAPHRMGDFANYIKGDKATLSGATPPNQTLDIESTAHCTFKPGEDGDGAACQTYYRPIFHNNVGIKRGYWVDSFTDHVDYSRKELPATISRREKRQISTESVDLNWGRFDNYVVVLRGFDMDLKNPDSGETGYIFPTHFKIKIEKCVLSADRKNIDCELVIQITREDNPDIDKGQEERMTYDFKVYFTVIGGDSQDFQETLRKRYGISDKHFEKGTAVVSRTETLHPTVDALITGITGFEFSLESNQIRDGRFLKNYEMYVFDHAIDRAKRQKKLSVYMGINGLPTPIIGTNAATFNATIYTVHMAFKNDPLSTDSTQQANMALCTSYGWTSPIVNCGGMEKTSDSQSIQHTISSNGN
ncbi:MAG: hypothetical protein R3293_28560 [Candidatus Promineifilaceae bacterium]|nr:hypothetical protein [Candidatus Promineifilaceae bacterium]